MSLYADKRLSIESETSFFVYIGSSTSIGVCNLRIIYGKKRTVFLLSELVENPGSSITSAISDIWLQLQKKYPEQTKNNPLLIVHYDDRVIYSDDQGGNRYAEITIDKTAVRWRERSQSEIAEIAETDESILMISSHILSTHMERLYEEVNNECPCS